MILFILCGQHGQHMPKTFRVNETDSTDNTDNTFGKVYREIEKGNERGQYNKKTECTIEVCQTVVRVVRAVRQWYHNSNS